MESNTRSPSGIRWDVAPPFDEAEAWARKLGTVPLVAQVLHNRGIDTPDACKAFLDPKLSDLHDPELLNDAVVAGERIAAAIADNQRIVIYGDYDVDGITSVAILHGCIKLLGGQANYYVPHRLDEGYGVNIEAVRKIVSDGAELMITVDCGVSAVEPIAEAVAGGVDVIVTDHHGLGDELPEAVAIVHPRVGSVKYPNADLAGAGVAFKLAWQIARAACGKTRVDERMRAFLLDATCLAALGTIADVVPLTGENRVLATYGLRGLPGSKHPGLRALLESANLTTGKLNAFDVGFVLAPRLNACGRMGHAKLAVELLTDAEPDRCKEIVEYLAKQNTERQKIERQIAEEAIEMVTSSGHDQLETRVIVVASRKWHGGVIGIVASRLVRRFGKPAFVIAVNGDGLGQGSGRSIPGFHMRDALAACSEHLVGFGGHAMAGGLRVELGKIEAFTETMLAYAAEKVSDEQLAPQIAIDAEVTLAGLGYNIVSHLERLAPFGQGNQPPVVAVRDCKLLTEPKRMGRSGNVVGLQLGQNGVSMRAVGFGMGELADKLAGVKIVSVAATPTLNTFSGRTNVELKIKDVTWG